MKRITLLFFLCFTCIVYSGDFKLGKVSKEELEEKEHPSDPSAVAAILYKKGKTYFDISESSWMLVTEVEVRVKIYKKEGYDYANVSIPFYHSKTSSETVTFSNVVTYNLIDGKIEKSLLKKKDNFIEEVSRSKSYNSILFSDVREGSVLEYKYKLKSPYIYDFPVWYFQYMIPVNNVEYTVNIPSVYVYNRIMNSYYPIKETSSNQPRKAYSHYLNFEFTDLCQHYEAKDLPAFKEELFINNPDNYRLFVKHELAATYGANNKKKEYVTNWEAVAKLLHQDDDFGYELKKISYFKDDIDALLSGITDDRKKMEIIFNYVQERMVWNKVVGTSTWFGVARAYKERIGNSGDINLMLTAMLSYAGLKASPVVLSTSDNGEVTFVSVNSLNYVIAGVEFKDEVVLLDATSKYANPGFLPVNDLNGSGRLLREDYTYRDVSLNPDFNSKESIYLIAQINEDGRIEGKVNSWYSDYSAIKYKEDYSGFNEEQHIQQIEEKLGGVEIADFEVSNNKEAKVNFSFNTNTELIGDKIYISPLLFYTETQNPFTEEKRIYPLSFIFPKTVRLTFVLTIPEGYEVESIPESAGFVAEEGIATYNFNVIREENKLYIKVVSSINYHSIGAEYYDSLKEYTAKIISKQAEKIILKRK